MEPPIRSVSSEKKILNRNPNRKACEISRNAGQEVTVRKDEQRIRGLEH